ncbi:MAG: cytosine deaminase, partial [Clostridiales bacterium]|nr:cytosine deaminase [Clostridiales bacterium]
YIDNAKETSDILVRGGKIAKIAPNIDTDGNDECIDLKGKLVIPPFVDSHLHLDTTHIADGGASQDTLWNGIAYWARVKKSLTPEAVKERALKAIRLAVSRGVQHIRTHIDICTENPVALHAMLELKAQCKDICNIQIIAFPQEGILSFPHGKALLERAIGLGADGIGGIPHYEYTREYAVESMNVVADLCAKYNVLADVHCDETDDESARGLETLAARALELGIGDRVTASHTTAMASYSDAYMNRLLRVLQKSNLNFVANPLVNIHLQGRFDGYPKRRGMTRVKELTAAGLNVSFGQDDVRDPWYPMGNGNMVEVIAMGLHVGHMLTYDEILSSYKFATYNGARSLHIQSDYGILEGRDASFIVLDAVDFFEVVRDKSEVLYSFHKGRVIASSVPAQRTIRF